MFIYRMYFFIVLHFSEFSKEAKGPLFILLSIFVPGACSGILLKIRYWNTKVCVLPPSTPRLQASRRRTLSFSERHQKQVDTNYCKQLHVQSVRKIQNQIRDQMVQNENDDLVERKRFLRLLQDEQFELDMEEAIQKVHFTIH